MTRSLQADCESGGACASVMGDSGEGVTREDLSNAYCSLAEVYLTDSWYVVEREGREGGRRARGWGRRGQREKNG